MKKIDIDFIPFSIFQEYKYMKQFIEDGKEILLFEKYKAKTNILQARTNKIYLYFELLDISKQIKQDIIEALNKKYGNPQYIGANNEFVWKTKNYYISYGYYKEYNMQTDFSLYIFFEKPYLQNIDEFYQIENIKGKIAYNWNIKQTTITTKSNGYLVTFQTNKYVYLVSINNKIIDLSSFKKENNGLQWNQKVKFKNINEIFSIISNFFHYVMEYDLELESGRIIYAKVKFYKDKRKSLPLLSEYRPHVLVNNDETYYGVQFIQGQIKEFDKQEEVLFKLLYDLDYSNLKDNKKFFIAEGSTIVGEGEIIDIENAN